MLLRGAEGPKETEANSLYFLLSEKQVAAVEELLREGRAALHTSIASYKFLITYGLLFSVLKLACYYYGVIMCQVRRGFLQGREVEREREGGGRSLTATWSSDRAKLRSAFPPLKRHSLLSTIPPLCRICPLESRGGVGNRNRGRLRNRIFGVSDPPRRASTLI